MYLTEDHSNAIYQIKAYLPNAIVINQETYKKSFIISPNQLIQDWEPNNIQELNEENLMILTTLKSEMILLGTGQQGVMVPAKQLRPLLERGMSVECMSTVAACRTYTVLIAEGRQVVAGLIIESTT